MRIHFLPLYPLLLCLTACADQIEDLTRVDDFRYNAHYAVPLIDSRVTLDELIDETGDDFSVTVNDDGILTFTYAGDLPPLSGSDILEAAFPFSTRLDAPVEGSVSIPLTETDGADLEEVRLGGGQLTFCVVNRLNRRVTATFSLPTVTRNGVSIERSRVLPPWNGSGEPPKFTNLDSPIDLSGYTFSAPGGTLSATTLLTTDQGQIESAGEGSAITLENVDVTFVRGRLTTSQAARTVSGRARINLFDSYRSGTLEFTDPTITLTTTSTIGLPARLDIDRLTVETVDSLRLPARGDFIRRGIAIDYPRQPGQSVTSVEVIDGNNSNVDSLLGRTPAAVSLTAGAALNPTGATVSGFISDTSSIRTRIEVDLPLAGNTEEFVFSDTLDLDLSESIESAEALALRITTYNSLPFSVDIGGEFLDDNGGVVADLTQGRVLIVQGAAEGATEPARASQDIEIDADVLDAVRTSRRLVLSVGITTLDDGREEIRVTPQDELQILIGAVITVDN